MARTSVTAEDVVAEAERIVETDGFDQLSVRRIGEALGVSRQVVYTHFGGMHGLVGELHTRTGRALAERLTELDQEPGTIEQVLAAGAIYLDEARKRPRLYELAFGRALPSYEPDEETLAVARETFEPMIAIASAWLDAHSDGEPAAQRDAVMLALVMWRIAHGHVALELAGHAEPAVTDQLLARALTAVVTGWQAPSAATTAG
jgi:AcrR family transcriptional regulator